VKLWPRVWCLVFLTHGVETAVHLAAAAAAAVLVTVVDLVEIPTSTRHLKASRDGRCG